MSALSMSALAAAQAELDKGVRGGVPVRFRSPEIDSYMLSVGLSAPPDAAGWPWCAAFVHWCFNVAVAQINPDAGRSASDPNPCPRTASALHLWQQTPEVSQTQLPAPGDVFVLVHRDGIHGHCGFVESCSPGGDVITTIEGDTNAEGSSTGDAVGRHTWTPGDGKRGRLLGYLAL